MTQTTKTKSKPATERKPRAKGKYYIDRKELLAEVVKSKELGRMSDRLASMLVLLTSKYAKSSQYIGYSFNDDMQGYAQMMLVRTWNSFDPNKSDNPFAFYTQCIKHSFIQYLNQEKRHRDIRDSLLVNNGLSPSYSYQADYEERREDERRVYDEEDHSHVVEESKSQNSESSFEDHFSM